MSARNQAVILCIELKYRDIESKARAKHFNYGFFEGPKAGPCL